MYWVYDSVRRMQKQLWRVANLYSDIKAARPLSAEDDIRMTQAFDTHISAQCLSFLVSLFTGSVFSQLDKRLSIVPQEASLACLVEALLAEHGAADVCYQGVKAEYCAIHVCFQDLHP